MARPRTLLSVPCDTHGDGPCANASGCKNRRERAGLPPVSRPVGRREAARIARAQVAAWARASLDVGAPISDADGRPMDPDGRDYEYVREALDEVLAGLES